MVWGHGSFMVSVLNPQALLSPAEVETSWQTHTILKGELFACQFVYSARIKLEFLAGKWDHASSLPCCISPWEMLAVFLWFLIVSCTLLWLSTRPWNLTLIFEVIPKEPNWSAWRRGKVLKASCERQGVSDTLWVCVEMLSWNQP